jgi:pSer/pThr/pTyr-binding forkhead associated (FHA) protein
MPLTLVVRSGPNETGDSHALTFDGPRVVIGRGGGCDVRLPDPSVSHRHAIVRMADGKHALVDEGSTNGTFVGGVRLAKGSPRALRTGDLIRVGRVWLEARIDQTPPTRDLAAATRELALLLVSQAMAALGNDTVPKVRVVEGPDAGGGLALVDEGRAYLVGRGESCDLALADADASREHVQLVRRGQTILARDLGSKNGALLGDARLVQGRDTPWKNNFMLRIAHTVLALEEPVALALGALEDAPDEPIQDEDVLPEPAPKSVKPETEANADAPPATDGVVPSVAGNAAPIAEEPSRTAAAPVRRRSGWSATDVAVVLAALLVIALSVAGLVWLLKG